MSPTAAIRACCLCMVLATMIAVLATGCASLRRYKIVPDSVAACRDYQREGAAARERGEEARARDLLAKAVSASPTDVDARRQLADVLWQEGRRDEAIRHIEAAVKLDPHDAPTVVRAGGMLADVGQSASAMELAQQAIRLDVRLAEAWGLRGRIYRQQRKYDAAMSDFQRALQYAPESQEILLSVAELHYQQGRPQRALTTLHRLLDVYPESSQPQRALWLEGLAYQAVERPADAAASLLAASRQGEPHPDLLYQLAMAEAAIGRPAAAAEAAERALALNGRHQGSRELLAELRTAGGATLRR